MSSCSTTDPGPTLNSEDFKDLVHNAMSMRSELINKFMDPRRDYDKECGYPETGAITADDYKRLYERDPIAARVNDCLTDECWKIQPSVYEDENAESVTEFEEAWDNLGRSLRGGSFYQDEEGSPIWEYLSRADKLSGIGSFGVILLGLNDLKQNEGLSKPIKGYEDWMPGLKEALGENIQGTDAQYDEAWDDETSPQKETSSDEIKLTFIRVFDESLVKITRYDSTITSPRYGQPIIYELTFINPNDQAKGGIGLPLATQNVHWSRIIHVTDNLSSSEIFGDPRMRTVWNRLMDLTKLYGGSAEMYWKGAFPGISLNIDPKMGGDIQVDNDSIREAMFKYTNSLQRWFALAGVSASSLSPQVVDPTQQINVQLEAICVDLAIPKRIFMGSERGELASSQDAGSWNDRLKGRQKGYITPRIIIPFVDRLIIIGILPQPKGFSVSWPEVGLNQAQKIANGSAILSALGTYTSMGLESVVELKDVYTRFFGMSEEEADAILENRRITLEDKQAEAEEQAAMAQLQQLQGMDPTLGDEEAPPEEEPPTENKKSTCPPALLDNKLNVKNHLLTIKGSGLGPADPRISNSKFWKEKAKLWDVTEGDARGFLCANCEHFIATSAIKKCIDEGPAKDLKASALPLTPKWADIESKPVAYCSLHQITCSPLRTCNDYESGGPIDDVKAKALGIDPLIEKEDDDEPETNSYKARLILNRFKR